jgi:hypothetical protein
MKLFSLFIAVFAVVGVAYVAVAVPARGDVMSTVQSRR